VKFIPPHNHTVSPDQRRRRQLQLFLLTLANTICPFFGALPDGTVQFQPTNKLAFTASSVAGINSNSIQVT